MNMHRNATRLGFVLSATLLTGTASAGIVIDDFDSDPNDDFFGDRTFDSYIVNNPFAQSGDSYIDTAFSTGDDDGALFFNAGVGVQQVANLEYDLDNGPVDLLTGGNSTIEFDFLEVDQDFLIRIVMHDSFGGKAVTDALAVTAGSNQIVSVNIEDEFDFFSLDLSSIDQVEFVFNTQYQSDTGEFVNTASLDFALSEIRVVPTPGALALLSLGALVGTRRQR